MLGMTCVISKHQKQDNTRRQSTLPFLWHLVVMPCMLSLLRSTRRQTSRYTISCSRLQQPWTLDAGETSLSWSDNMNTTTLW